NYEDLILHATLTIQKAESIIVAESDQFHVYDGTEKVVLAYLNHDETEFVYSPDSSFTDVGTYTIHIQSAESANYLSSELSVNLTILPAKQEGITFEDGSYVYNGEVWNLSVSGMSLDAEIIYDNNGQTEAGTYTVTATIKRSNYEDLILHATLTIQKAESVIIADSMQFYVLDGTEKRVIAQLSHQETELIIKPYNSFVMPGIYKIEIFSIETNNFLKASKRITL